MREGEMSIRSAAKAAERTRVASGFYAEVIDRGDGTVVKAYLRAPRGLRGISDPKKRESRIRELWRVEVAMYERVQSRSDLARFVPRFYGAVDPCALAGVVAPERFVSGCGLHLERLVGSEHKMAELSSLHPSIFKVADGVLDRISELAVGLPEINVLDASCFVLGAGEAFKLIDFATSVAQA